MQKIFFALCFILASLLTSAKDKVSISAEPLWLYPVAVDPTRQTSLKDVSNGYYLELFDEQFNLINQTKYTHLIKHVVNESGVQNASEISVVFAPEYQELIFHYIRIIRNKQVVSQLNMNEIKVVQEETDAESFEYDGTKRAFVILKDVKKGDRIEAAYSVKGFNPVFKNRFSTDLYFSDESPITNYFETILVQPDRKLFLTYHENANKPTEQVIANTRIFHWKNPSIKLWETQKNTPAWFNNYPYVAVTEYSNWNEVIDWGTKLYKNYQCSLPQALEKKIAEWRQTAAGDRDTFITLASRFVQDEIRYLGIEVGIHSHQPHNPSDVFAQGYGDCKDKALLLATILRHEKIIAYAALVNTSERSGMINSEPTPTAFDHVIVAVEHEADFRYIDATMSRQGGAFPSLYVPDYHYALVLREGETGLRAIAAQSVNKVAIDESWSVAFLDTTHLTVTSSYEGGRADGVRRYLANESARDLKDSYTEFYSADYDEIRMDEDVTWEDYTEINSLIVNESYILTNAWKNENKKKIFSTFAKSIDAEINAPVKTDQKLPVSLSYPLDIKQTIEINFPEEWSMNRKEIHIKNESYQFDFEPSVVGKLVLLKYHLITFKDHIPVQELDQYKKDYERISKSLGYDFTYTGFAPKHGGDSNSITIVISLLEILGLIKLFRRLNRTTVEVPRDRDDSWPIGGWVILLGISLFLSWLQSLYVLMSSQYFSWDAWLTWLSVSPSLIITVLVELVIGVFQFFATAVLFYWYVKQRDIFPKMFNWYVGILLVSEIILLLIYSLNKYPESYGNLASAALKSAVQTMIYGVIWCTYLFRSYRVKVTFVK